MDIFIIYVTYYTEVQVFEKIVIDVDKDMDSWQYFEWRPGSLARTCNVATDRLGQLGCTWTVFHRSSSELRISVRIKLNDVDTHK